jgi:phosphoribosyl-ATP pyrophosphohydrolase/phosphoribosyl-AMP cyclohydrolase
MVAYATSEALKRTLETGRATFWSRSRSELWEKGRTSGNEIRVSQVLVDCDADCVIYSGEPHGNSCHTGAPSCFFQALEAGEAPSETQVNPERENPPLPNNEAPLLGLAPPKTNPPLRLASASDRPQTLLSSLEALLEMRKSSTGSKSYTKKLFDAGAPGIGAKLEEESRELVQALGAESDERVISEAADVLYHLLVGLRWRSIPLRRVLAELARRLGVSGHAEKAARSKPQAAP